MKNGGKLHMGILAFCHYGGKNYILCGPQNPKPTQDEGYQITQKFVPWGSFKKWKWNLTQIKLLLWPKGSYLSKLSILLLVV